MAEEKFTRLTGMFRMARTPQCTTGTVGGEWLATFVEMAQDALNTPGKSIQFSHWDNGEKPCTLNFRVVDEQQKQARPAPARGQRYAPRGGQGGGQGQRPAQRQAYTPYAKKPQPIPIEEPLWEGDDEGPVSQSY